jgi:hypothetical protein
MERYQQQFPKLTTMEAWLAKAHPDAPALPWRGDDGREVCSLAVVPLEHTSRARGAVPEAHGRCCVTLRADRARPVPGGKT